ncbi:MULTISPECIES: hypothetical protein [Amycolatopsis]|uniref:hypothetical protein n=1 Tax=Amycolatopsis TaxID=1813 RepID=UPI000B0556F2|nr:MULTISPECIES: hypothetical protein [Amycolatopsis]MYW92512.1 hypothetical protein [Amycolatopsis rubida]
MRRLVARAGTARIPVPRPEFRGALVLELPTDGPGAGRVDAGAEGILVVSLMPRPRRRPRVRR